MPNIGAKIYFSNVTGEVLKVVSEKSGPWVVDTSFREDMRSYPELQGLDEGEIGVVKIDYGDHAEDLLTQIPVSVKKGVIQWVPIDSPAEAPQTKPFSERLANVETEAVTTMMAITDAYESQLAADANREGETVVTMMGLSEAYEMILSLQARIEVLERGDA